MAEIAKNGRCASVILSHRRSIRAHEDQTPYRPHYRVDAGRARSARDAAWKWTGTYGDKAVEMLIIGDIQVHSRRADPTTAFNRMRDTLKKADLVYANLEGLLVKSVGTTIDIPDKPEWTHPGPDGVKALKAVEHRRRRRRQQRRLGPRQHPEEPWRARRQRHHPRRRRQEHRRGAQAGDRRAQRRQDRLPAVHRALVSGQGHDRDRHRSRRREDHVARRHHDRSRRSRSRSRPTSRSCARSSTSSSSRITTATARRRCSSARSRARAPAAIASKTEEYQKQFAHVALDTGADLVFGHGTHTIQGVEIYNGKPILYAIGHSNFDQPGYEKSTDGLVARVVIQGKSIRARVVRAGHARRQQRRLPARSVRRRRREARAEGEGAFERAAGLTDRRPRSRDDGEGGRYELSFASTNKKNTIDREQDQEGDLPRAVRIPAGDAAGVAVDDHLERCASRTCRRAARSAPARA